MPPLLQMVGPLLPPPGTSSPTELQASLVSWMDKDKNKPTVVVELGAVGNAALSPSIVKEMVNGILNTGVRCLWILPEDLRSSLPEPMPSDTLLRVAPSTSITTQQQRQAVLQHPRVAVVVTSCSLFAAQQVLYHAKAIFALPRSPDQLEAALRLQELNVAEVLPSMPSLRASNITKRLKRLLRDPTVVTALRRTSSMLREAGGVTAAADHVLRMATEQSRNPRGLLVPRKESMAWYSYFAVDVYAIYGMVLFGLAVIVRTVCCGVWATVANGLSFQGSSTSRDGKSSSSSSSADGRSRSSGGGGGRAAGDEGAANASSGSDEASSGTGRTSRHPPTSMTGWVINFAYRFIVWLTNVVGGAMSTGSTNGGPQTSANGSSVERGADSSGPAAMSEAERTQAAQASASAKLRDRKEKDKERSVDEGSDAQSAAGAGAKERSAANGPN